MIISLEIIFTCVFLLENRLSFWWSYHIYFIIFVIKCENKERAQFGFRSIQSTLRAKYYRVELICFHKSVLVEQRELVRFGWLQPEANEYCKTTLYRHIIQIFYLQ